MIDDGEKKALKKLCRGLAASHNPTHTPHNPCTLDTGWSIAERVKAKTSSQQQAALLPPLLLRSPIIARAWPVHAPFAAR
jgi:hypothetical protein